MFDHVLKELPEVGHAHAVRLPRATHSLELPSMLAELLLHDLHAERLGEEVESEKDALELRKGEHMQPVRREI